MTELRLHTNRTVITDARDLHGRAQELVVRATVVAPDVVQSTARRLPLHIAFVIDRSGSMSGRKLVDALNATQRMVQRLDNEDRCVIVTFDTDVALLADGAPLSDARRAMISHALHQVRTGGSTNLAGGWDLAVQTLLAHHTPNECISRVVILTDGVANVGMRDPASLAAQAKIYADLGVSTSTYGLGHGYNEAALTGMSQAGLGNHQFIEESSDIDGFFGHELHELFTVALTNATLTAALPVGYSVELLGGQPHTLTGQSLRVDIGALVALEQRSFFLRLIPLSLSQHGEHTLSVAFTGIDSAQQQREAARMCQWQLSTASHAATALIHRDIEQEAALIDMARIRAEAAQMNKEGRYAETRSYIQEQQTRSSIFASMHEYDEMAAFFEKPLTERVRKGEAVRAYRERRSSSKDLMVLRQLLARLIHEGAPMRDIVTVQAEIDRLEGR